MMNILTGRELMRLKEEYTDALVESMSTGQVYAYLKQVLYNDVSVEDGETVAKKIVRQFGEDFYNELVTDITKAAPAK